MCCGHARKVGQHGFGVLLGLDVFERSVLHCESDLWYVKRVACGLSAYFGVWFVLLVCAHLCLRGVHEVCDAVCDAANMDALF